MVCYEQVLWSKPLIYCWLFNVHDRTCFKDNACSFMLSRSRLKLVQHVAQRQTRCMGPYVGVDYNLTLCPLQRRLQHIYHGPPYARLGRNPMPESTSSPIQLGTLDLASVLFTCFFLTYNWITIFSLSTIKLYQRCMLLTTSYFKFFLHWPTMDIFVDSLLP